MRSLYHTGFLLGGVSLLLFLLGRTGVTGRLPLFIVTLCACAVLVTIVWRGFTGSHRAARVQRGGAGWVVFPLSLFIALMLPLVMLPPTARDALIVHLALPKIFLQAGRIVDVPFMSFSSVPLNGDLLYLIPLAFGSDTVPQLIHFVFAVLTGLLLYCYLSERAGRVHGIVGLFIYLTTPVVVMQATTAYIDLSLTFYSTLALIALLKWREEGYAAEWLLYSAVATGLALGTKYSALVLLLIMCASVVYLYSRESGEQWRAVKAGCLYMAVALIIFSPWMIKNIIVTGNPLYPLAQGVFNAQAGGGAGFHITSLPPLLMRKFLYGEEFWYVLLIPLRIFWEGRDGSHQYFDGLLNPFYLLIIPMAFLGTKWRDRGVISFFTCFFFIVAFFTIDLVIRYLLPIIPALVIFMVMGLATLMATKRGRIPALLLITALFLFNGWYIVGLYQKYQPAGYYTGTETRDAYLARMLPDYDAIRYGNKHLPEGARVMLVFAGDRGYYWERDYFYGSRGGGYIIKAVNESSDERDLARHFRTGGATHLFIQDRFLLRFAQDNLDGDRLERFNRFYREQLTPLYGSNGFSLYEISARGV